MFNFLFVVPDVKLRRIEKYYIYRFTPYILISRTRNKTEYNILNLDNNGNTIELQNLMPGIITANLKISLQLYGVFEICDLLGNYTASCGNCPMVQMVQIILKQIVISKAC